MMNVFLLFLIVVSISLLFTQTVFAQTTDEEKKKLNLYRDKGIEFSDIGKYERAIRYFKAALEIKPSDSTTLGELGFVYFIEGDFKRAVEYFEQAQRLSPENENILEKLKKLEDFGYKFIPTSTEHEHVRMKGPCAITLFKNGKLLIQGKEKSKNIVEKLLKT